jgi:hypothetical protein
LWLIEKREKRPDRTRAIKVVRPFRRVAVAKRIGWPASKVPQCRPATMVVVRRPGPEVSETGPSKGGDAHNRAGLPLGAPNNFLAKRDSRFDSLT